MGATENRARWPRLCRWGFHKFGWTGSAAMGYGKLYRCERDGCTCEYWGR